MAIYFPVLYNIPLLLIYFIHCSPHLLIPFLYLALPSPHQTWNWFELSLEFWIIFLSYFLPPVSLLRTSPTHQVGVSFPKTALRTSIDYKREEETPNSQSGQWDFHLPTSFTISVYSLLDPEIMLHSSLSLKPKFHHPFTTNSNTTSPWTLPSNFFASS